MLHAARLTQAFDEDAYLQRVLDMRDTHSPNAIVNKAIDEATTDSGKPMSDDIKHAFKILANGPQIHQFVELEDEYILMLARLTAGQKIDKQRLHSLEEELREQYPFQSEHFTGSIRDIIETERAFMAGEPISDEQQSPVRRLFALIVCDALPEDTRDDIMTTDANEYISRLRSVVRLTAREFGLDRANNGPAK